MPLREINFDGIIGPSHNYSGLSAGNLASLANRGNVAHPRAAALQGVDKMRKLVRLGVSQALLLPHARPNHDWLATLGTNVEQVSSELRPAAFSASAMWAANAATSSPAPDCGDGRCHFTVANLRTMAHRSHEWPETLAQLRLAFANEEYFAVHLPIPATFGDEGAANHMRVGPAHDTRAVEIFVYGRRGGSYPVRQHEEACRAIARLHRLDPARTLFVCQSNEAIAAGAFHNDVVAVANEKLLLVHEQAYEDQSSFYAALRHLVPEVEIVEVPAAAVSLADAIKTYLFNGQLVTMPRGGMGLILPVEARETEAVFKWLNEMVADNGTIREIFFVDVRQSMANGGGPACLRLRVVADPLTIDPRFLADEAKLNRISALIEKSWPAEITPDDLSKPHLWQHIERARQSLFRLLGLEELL